MKQLTVQIPENKFSFIIELLDNLGIKDIHENDLYIPDWHKEIVLERLNKHEPSKAIDLNMFEKRMQEKHGL